MNHPHRTDHYILMGSGGHFSYTDPSDCTMTIDDYAWALASTGRFRGQTIWNGQRVFFSVAEHCTLGALAILSGDPLIDDAIEEWRLQPHERAELALAFLMHESGEVPFGDPPSPMKAAFPVVKEIEKAFVPALLRHFEVPVSHPTLVKWIDNLMYFTERRDYQAHAGPAPANAPMLTKRLTLPQTPDAAASTFLATHDFLHRTMQKDAAA